MYSCNLSWKPLIEILKRLEGNGLITATIPENTTRKQLSLTPKGSIALEGYLKAMEQLKFLNPSKEEGM
jgi:predicted transcriptional regulator